MGIRDWRWDPSSEQTRKYTTLIVALESISLRSLRTRHMILRMWGWPSADPSYLGEIIVWKTEITTVCGSRSIVNESEGVIGRG